MGVMFVTSYDAMTNLALQFRVNSQKLSYVPA